MAVSFGSIGDIIAICQLVQSVAIAFKDSTGSSAQFQELSRTLAKLATALGEAGKLETSQRDSIDTTSLLSILEQCDVSLKGFLGTIRKYEPSLRPGGTGNVIKDGYRKLRWQSQKEDVERFQREIGSLLDALQVVLSTVGINIQVQGAKVINFRLNDMDSLLQKILAVVLTENRGGLSNQEYGAIAEVNEQKIATAAAEGPSKSVPFAGISTIADPSAPVSIGYDAAVDVCKSRVEELVKECRRTNQRYRDAYFDLQDDVFYGNRLCLQSLDNGGSNLEPGGVSSIGEIYDRPQLYAAGAVPDLTPAQDGFGWLTCAVMALGSLAGLIGKLLVARDEQCGIYGAVFFRDGEWVSHVVDDRLYTTYPPYDDADPALFDRGGKKVLIDKEDYMRIFQRNSPALYFGSCGDPGETWFAVLEKAYAKAHGDYASIMNGFVGEGLEDLTGGVTFEISIEDVLDREYFWNETLLRASRELVCTAYWKNDITKSSRDARSTAILKAVEVRGERLLLLRDGNENGLNWTGAWSDGSSQWTADWMQSLGHRFGDDSVTWMGYSDFLDQFEYLNYTRIFGSEWSLSQQWAALQIPKYSGFTGSKFQITIASISPVVIALSQIDTRYFRSLEDPYEYSLAITIRKEGFEILSRTRRWYTLKRSCAVEMELDAGTYIVHPTITATKLPETNVIGDLLSSNDRKKREKLLKVALSRDLAYAKVKASPFEEKIEATEDWNATCNLGLKVYVRDGDSTIEVLWERPSKAERRELTAEEKQKVAEPTLESSD